MPDIFNYTVLLFICVVQRGQFQSICYSYINLQIQIEKISEIALLWTDVALADSFPTPETGKTSSLTRYFVCMLLIQNCRRRRWLLRLSSLHQTWVVRWRYSLLLISDCPPKCGAWVQFKPKWCKKNLPIYLFHSSLPYTLWSPWSTSQSRL